MYIFMMMMSPYKKSMITIIHGSTVPVYRISKCIEVSFGRVAQSTHFTIYSHVRTHTHT